MEMIFQYPFNWILATVLFDTAAVSGWRGACQMFRRLREGSDAQTSLELVYGIRRIIVGAAALVLMGGVLFANKWLLVFGVIFLLEELYETGIVILALRLGSK